MRFVELNPSELASIVGGNDLERVLRILPALDAKAAQGETAAERAAFAAKARELRVRYQID